MADSSDNTRKSIAPLLALTLQLLQAQQNEEQAREQLRQSILNAVKHAGCTHQGVISMEDAECIADAVLRAILKESD